MKTTILLRLALESIRRNRMRTSLTMLGIVIGVAAVIVTMAVGYGARSQIEKQIQTLGTNLIVVTAGSSVQGGANLGAGTFNRLTAEDADKIRREATLLTAVSPVIVTRTQVIAGSGNWRSEINGVSADYFLIRNWGVSSGVPFDDEDVRTKRKVALLGATIAANLFPDADPVGSPIRLGRTPFTVIGVLARKGQTATGADQDDIVLMPYTTAQDRLSGFSFLAQIVANTGSAATLTPAQEEIRSIMRESHGLVGGTPDDFTVRDQTAIAQAATTTTSVMTSLLTAIAAISLLVGGIGVMNIMLVSVTERTREIGIRMALGARGSDILSQFLTESLAISLFGGLIGLAAGYGGGAILGRATGWSTTVPPSAVALAVGFSALVGVFFGYYPARKAARLDPIEALHYE